MTQLYDEVLRPTGLRVTQFGILGATMAMVKGQRRLATCLYGGFGLFLLYLSGP